MKKFISFLIIILSVSAFADSILIGPGVTSLNSIKGDVSLYIDPTIGGFHPYTDSKTIKLELNNFTNRFIKTNHTGNISINGNISVSEDFKLNNATNLLFDDIPFTTWITNLNYVQFKQDKNNKYTAITLGRRINGNVGENSVAIGVNCLAEGNSSIAMGLRPQTYTNYSVSIGQDTKTYNIHSRAYGNESETYGQYSVADGIHSKTTNNYSYVWSGNPGTEVNKTITVTNGQTITFSDYCDICTSTTKISDWFGGITDNFWENKWYIQISDNLEIYCCYNDTNYNFELWKNYNPWTNGNQDGLSPTQPPDWAENITDLSVLDVIDGEPIYTNFTFLVYNSNDEQEISFTAKLDNKYYYSHGDGTFNINPTNGLDGVYIGETNLQTYLNNIDEYVKVNHEGDVNIKYGKLKIDNGLSVGFPSIGTQSFSPGPKAVFAGNQGYSKGEATIALGTYIMGEDSYSFIWGGNFGNWYETHGEGTFNINPKNGLNGIYIGETNLNTILNLVEEDYDKYYAATEITTINKYKSFENVDGTSESSSENYITLPIANPNKVGELIIYLEEDQLQSKYFDFNDDHIWELPDPKPWMNETGKSLWEIKFISIPNSTLWRYVDSRKIDTQFYTWELSSDGHTITNLTSNPTREIIVSEKIDSYYPTSLGNNLFTNRTGIETIFLPDTITSFGTNVFEGCTDLKYVNIPEGVEELNGTFIGCTSLEHIELPSTITNIDTNAFANCSSLSSIIIPDSVSNIGENAFANCAELKNIDTRHVHTIGNNAFTGCSGITNISFGGSPISIGENILVSSNPSVENELKSITFSLSVAKWGQTNPVLFTVSNNAFTSCTGVERIYYNKGIPMSATAAENIIKEKLANTGLNLNSIQYICMDLP